MNFEGFSTGNKSVQVISTDASSLQQDYTEAHGKRLESRGGHFSSSQLIPVYCAALVGYDADDVYNNLLYNLREELVRTDKLLIFKADSFNNPRNDETGAFTSIDRTDKHKMISGLCARLIFPNDPVRTDSVRRALSDMLSHSSDPVGKLFNVGVKLVVWYNRCINCTGEFQSGLREIPVMLFYGNITSLELQLLHLLSYAGFDVLYITPDKSGIQMLKEENYCSRMQIFELPNSKEVIPYPDKEVKTRVATVAYNAERELDTLLYGGDTMFRDYQFSDMESTVLKTTYDEIDVLWHQQSRYRTGFQVMGDRVRVPNIFAKISGVPDGNIRRYWDDVEEKLSPSTVIMVKAPAYKAPMESQLRMFDPYHDGHTLWVDKLKKSELNKYGFLSDELQLLIFNKIQEAYDSKFLDFEDERELMQYLIYVGLNLDRSILRILQKYDFTKDIPKFIVIDAIEDPFSKIECVQLVLLSMLGFDILIYTPTGYRNLEAYIKPNAYELHQMNEYKYNVTVPRFKIPDKIQQKKGGLFQNLFRKGR